MNVSFETPGLRKFTPAALGGSRPWIKMTRSYALDSETLGGLPGEFEVWKGGPPASFQKPPFLPFCFLGSRDLPFSALSSPRRTPGRGTGGAGKDIPGAGDWPTGSCMWSVAVQVLVGPALTRS